MHSTIEDYIRENSTLFRKPEIERKLGLPDKTLQRVIEGRNVPKKHKQRIEHYFGSIQYEAKKKVSLVIDQIFNSLPLEFAFITPIVDVLIDPSGTDSNRIIRGFNDFITTYYKAHKSIPNSLEIVYEFVFKHIGIDQNIASSMNRLEVLQIRVFRFYTELGRQLIELIHNNYNYQFIITSKSWVDSSNVQLIISPTMNISPTSEVFNEEIRIVEPNIYKVFFKTEQSNLSNEIRKILDK